MNRGERKTMLTSRSDYTSTPVRLSVIIPVYNERFTLERIVERVLAQEGSPGIASLQIIVVDDCSKDGSREILQNLAAKYPQILAAYHDKNQGKAGGIRTGISKADGDVILFQDADLEYDPGEYSRLLRPILEGRPTWFTVPGFLFPNTAGCFTSGTTS